MNPHAKEVNIQIDPHAKEVNTLNGELCHHAREGDLEALYKALKDDPKSLDKIDEIPFVHTPLHEAAANRPHTPRDEDRRIEFALELLNLKPSFGRKLNPDGQSPLHLALHNGFSALAKRLIKYDSELIRVTGRERKTPLHCVAEVGDSVTETNLLAEFLFACPESLKDLTIRDETAFHIAVKHGQVNAFKLIFEWIWRSYNGELLIWKDKDGNTALHIAAFTNRQEIVEHLVRRAPIMKIERNLKGETAFQIAQEKRIKDVISGHVKVSRIPKDDGGLKKNITDLHEFLLSREPKVEKILRFILYCRRELSLDMRNMVLVVAVLIATSTYEDLGKVTEIQSSSTDNLGKSMGHFGKMLYYSFNTISFTASIAVMASVFSTRPFTAFLHLSLVFLAMSYGYKMIYISREQTPIPFVVILIVYACKNYFKSVEREIKMELPATWMGPSPKWQALPPAPLPLERLRMVYRLMRDGKQNKSC